MRGLRLLVCVPTDHLSNFPLIHPISFLDAESTEFDMVKLVPDCGDTIVSRNRLTSKGPSIGITSFQEVILLVTPSISSEVPRFVISRFNSPVVDQI